MKYLLKTVFVFTFALFIFSCSQDEQIKNTEVSQSLESVLSEMSKTAKSENKIVKFTLLINKETDKYGFENIRLLENSQEILDFSRGVNQAISSKSSSGRYQVDCTDSEGNTTSTSCDDYKCVGYKVATCVENGGCATVCKAELTVAP